MIINIIAANKLIDKYLKTYNMGYIKEPEGVDFIIRGKPLTEKEKKAISEFIKRDKERLVKRKTRNTKSLNLKQKDS